MQPAIGTRMDAMVRRSSFMYAACPWSRGCPGVGTLAEAAGHGGVYCAVVQQSRQRLDAVHQPRAWAREATVRIHSPDRYCARQRALVEQVLREPAGLVEVEAAGRRHDHLGPSRLDGGPGRPHRPEPGRAEYGEA